MVIGYARVSTHEQELSLQLDALNKFGVDKIYTEKASGGKKRPILESLLSELVEGDTLVIWKLDRLGRVASELMVLHTDLANRGINLVSLTEDFNTSTPVGKFVVNIFCCINEMERNILIERTNAGLESARKKGKVGGRKKGLTNEAKKKAKLAAALYSEYLRNPTSSINELCEIVGVSKATFYKYLRLEGVFK
ncbi:recombinase family protein [Parabacteroides sp. PF5-9]|uniref:recombinase family protein n=1 Tax=Parabacteroides sp. PF5-9 TaxID=1742404 RepID=UPI002473E90E|nr:recombinase family protein [Parabacteroides sp. PF5-9]MDH6358911.1 DNA invertase Pin-like site-specific DNA recombinase [Parabacteroides sp. PF5-9]